jgi:hypothetical protein
MLSCTDAGAAAGTVHKQYPNLSKEQLQRCQQLSAVLIAKWKHAVLAAQAALHEAPTSNGTATSEHVVTNTFPPNTSFHRHRQRDHEKDGRKLGHTMSTKFRYVHVQNTSNNSSTGNNNNMYLQMTMTMMKRKTQMPQ